MPRPTSNPNVRLNSFSMEVGSRNADIEFIQVFDRTSLGGMRNFCQPSGRGHAAQPAHYILLIKRSDAEFMQKRRYVGAGPSSKT